MVKEETEREHRYSDYTPTQLRDREEKFRTAKWNPFWIAFADYVFFRMLQHRFFALEYKNKERYDNGYNPEYPCIFYAPHCNWWDGIVLYNLCQRVFHTRLLIMIEEMNRFPLFQYVGAFPVNKKSPQTAIKSLQHTVDNLVNDKTRKTALWIFPQGIIRPPHYRPVEFQTGVAYVAQKVIKKVGGINLIPISVEYCFLRDNRPEVLVDVGHVKVLTSPDFERHELTHELEKDFEALCDEHFSMISKGEVDDYTFVFKEKLPWYRQIEQYLKGRGFKFKKNSSSAMQ